MDAETVRIVNATIVAASVFLLARWAVASWPDLIAPVRRVTIALATLLGAAVVGQLEQAARDIPLGVRSLVLTAACAVVLWAVIPRRDD